MSLYDSADAILGVARYGQARYGVVTPTIELPSVSATGHVRGVHLDAFEVDITERVEAPAAFVGSIGSLVLHTEATIVGASSVAQVGVLEPQISFVIESTSAYEEFNGVVVHLSEKLDSVSAAFTVNDAGLDIKSINRVDVTGSGAYAQVGPVEPQVKEPVLGVSAVVNVSTVRQNLKKTPASVTATASAGILTHKNTKRVSSLVVVGSVVSVKENVQDRISGTQASSGVGTLRFSNKKKLTSTGMSISTGTLSNTAVKFDFYGVREKYSPHRTVLIPRAA